MFSSCHARLRGRKMTWLVIGLFVIALQGLAVQVASAAAVASGGDVTLIKQGKPVATIYISQPLEVPNLTAVQRRAATPAEIAKNRAEKYLAVAINDFNHHMELMTGAKLPVVVTDDPAKVKAPALVVGDLAVKMGATPKEKTTVHESYRLLTRNGLVLVGGEGPAGYSNGLYTVLYNLGCDWIMPGPEGVVAPKKSTITITAMDEAKKPDFEVRAPWYSGGGNIIKGDEMAQFYQWNQRQRQSMRVPGLHPLFMQGGHFWASLIRANKKLLTEHPEMRALVRKPDGTYVRGWGQLEPTNPAVIDLTVQWVKDQYKKRGLKKTDTLALSIGPNDGGGFSISAETLAAGSGRVDPITGHEDETDVMIYYTNKVLEKLQPEYPNAYLGWYIYAYYADYPQRYTPNPRFTADIADITYSRYQSSLDPRSFSRTYYKGIVEQWGKLIKKQGNPIWFYGYNWNLAENLMPYTKLKIWGQDLPWLFKQGIRGHNNEQDKAWSILGPHNYLMARLGWDMSLDWRDVLKEYTTKAFGKGGPEMDAYYLDLVDTQEKSGNEAGSYAATTLIFDRDFIKRSRAHFAKALAVATDPVHKRNIDYFSQDIRALEIYLDYHDAALSFNFPEAQKQFDNMVSHWQAYMDKNSNLVSRYGRRYINWLFKPYVAQALKYTTGDYHLAYKIPDALPTILDPNVKGQAMGFFHPEKPDKNLMLTKTYSTTWDAQGLWPLRDGAVWYRVWVDGNKIKPTAGQGVGLFLGAFEDHAEVWCNGKYVGNASGFIRPAAFDLTDFIKPGEKNLIAIQIIRTNMLNELNLGGLLYPSFIFTGPRLDKVAPNNQPMERILPGGSRETIKK